jgi:uncharacterized protein (DUF39 family)
VKTYEEINEKIRAGKAVVVTAEEMIGIVAEKGAATAAREVDVVTTATFSPMCSSGAFMNFGHTDPPIKMAKIWLNDVPASGGLAAVDTYLGATELSESEGLRYGGAHVIEDLVSGKRVKLRTIGFPTDCYPRKTWESEITRDSINQIYLFNPRNVYQNYAVATNSTKKLLYTYMGMLLPNFGNATYCSAGQLSPMLNDPMYRTIGIGTRIFLGGGIGYVAWEGTQHNPSQNRTENKVPMASAGTLALMGDLKKMSPRYLRAATMARYGVSMFVGVGLPIPILGEEMAQLTAVKDADIKATIFDYGVPNRSRPNFGQVTYAQLRSGRIEINGREVRTAPMSSYARAREIAGELKNWIAQGQFLLSAPVEPLSLDRKVKPLEPLPAETIEEVR